MILDNNIEGYYYLASPYSHKDNTFRIKRYEDALRAVKYFFDRKLVVYSPIVNTHPLAEMFDMPEGFEHYEKYDTVMLKNAVGVIVLESEGWIQSRGVQFEIDYAKNVLNIPVYYITMETINKNENNIL